MRAIVTMALVAACGGVLHAATGDAPRFDVPRLDGIQLDGSADDWGSAGLRVDAMAEAQGRVRAADEFSARFRLGWDGRGLLVLVTVHDTTPFEESNEDRLYARDSVELFIADRSGGTNSYQVVMAPGRVQDPKELRQHVYDRRKNAALKAIALSVTAARRVDDAGYTLEVLLPWDGLGVQPAAGRELALQLAVNDASTPNTCTKSLWYPKEGTAGNTGRMHRLQLAEAPSAPVEVAAAGSYERFRRTRIGVTATASHAGHGVEVRDGERVVGTGLLAADATQATCSLALPMPARGKAYGPLGVRVDGTDVATLVLDSPDEARQQAFARAEFAFAPCVFSGMTFPTCDFVQPAWVEDLVGSYTVTRTTFYDREGNVVTAPDRPGRYGAIVEIRAEDGETTRRFCTLYHMANEVNWREVEVSATANLPPELGLDDTVLREQAETLGGYFCRQMVDGFSRSSAGAIVMAGLAETPRGSETARQRNNAWRRDAEWWYRLRKRTGDLTPLKYLTYLPAGYEPDDGKAWPLVLFLHGSGERGDDLDKLKTVGLPKVLEARRDLPFVAIAPQCRLGEWWNPLELNELLDEVMARYRIDASRVYVTGLSMGGYGSWALALQYPERFAALIPICGGGDPADAARIQGIPTWVFHGGKDGIVPIKQSQAMVDALRALGGNVQFTVFPEAGHDSWTQAYATEELYTWMLEQRRR